MKTQTRLAVVGNGLIGQRHAAVIRQAPDLTLAGVVDPQASNRQQAADLGTRVFETLESLFAAGDVDGVILATPTPLHVEQGLACINAGIPVLIEKPIAVTASDALALTTAAESAGVPVLVGHHRRHNGMVRAAKAALDAGAVGEIRAVQATCWFYKPDYYFDVAPWRTKRGAGPISVNLVHDVDLLRHFCGEVASVQAISVPSRRGFENEDFATAILSFDSGPVATISVSDSIVAPWSWELTSRENPAYPATDQSCYLVGGSEGALSLPDLRVWRHDGGPDWWAPMSATSLTCGTEDPLVVQMAHFARVVRRECAPLVTGEEGLKSLEVVEAVAESSATGRTVRIGGGGA